MVKSTPPRHSPPRRDPVTIDLEAKDVVRDVKAEPEAAKAEAAKPSSATETPKADATPAATSSTPRITPSDKPSYESGPITGAKPVETASAAKPGEPLAAKQDDRSKPAFGRDPAPAAAKVEPPKTTMPPMADKAAPKPQPSGRGGLSMVAAGLVGGVVALVAGGALQYGGLLPTPGANGADAATIAALQADVAALKAAPATAGDPAAAAALTGRVDAVSAAIDQLKNDLAASAATGGDVSPAAAQALEDRFKALESAIAAAPQGGGDSSALTTQIATLEAGIAAATKAAQDQASAAQAAEAAAAARIAKLEETVAGLAGTVAEQAEQPNAALAISASSLKAAIDRGDPFTLELDTFAAIAPDSAEIQPLRAMAAGGVPSRTAIAAGFPDAANAMIAAAQSTDPNAGILDQLVASAQSLVQVRPVGMVAGEDAPAIVARMEVALTKGDYAAALAEYRALPQAAQTVGAAYAAQIEARLAADDLTTKMLSTALKA